VPDAALKNRGQRVTKAMDTATAKLAATVEVETVTISAFKTFRISCLLLVTSATDSPVPHNVQWRQWHRGLDAHPESTSHFDIYSLSDLG